MKTLYSLLFAALFLLAAGYASPYSHETGSTSEVRVQVRPQTDVVTKIVHPQSGEGALAVR